MKEDADNRNRELIKSYHAMKRALLSNPNGRIFKLDAGFYENNDGIFGKD